VPIVEGMELRNIGIEVPRCCREIRMPQPQRHRVHGIAGLHLVRRQRRPSGPSWSSLQGGRVHSDPSGFAATGALRVPAFDSRFQPLLRRGQSVTHVSGIRCYLSLGKDKKLATHQNDHALRGSLQCACDICSLQECVPFRSFVRTNTIACQTLWCCAMDAHCHVRAVGHRVQTGAPRASEMLAVRGRAPRRTAPPCVGSATDRRGRSSQGPCRCRTAMLDATLNQHPFRM